MSEGALKKANLFWCAMLIAPAFLGGLFSLVALMASANDVPSDDDYAKMSAYLEKEAKAGDALAVLPAWSLRAHTAAPQALDIISGDDLHLRPLGRYKRIFVVIESGGESDFDKVSLNFGNTKSIEVFGALTLARFDHEQKVRLVSDFREGLKSASVFVSGAEPVHCDRKIASGFDCPKRKDWQRVTREHLLVSENSDEMIWAHPPKPGHALEIIYNDIAVGERFVLRTALTRHASTRAHAPVDVEVWQDDVRLTSVSHSRAFGVKSHIFKADQKQKSQVVFRISSQAHGAAHFAFDAFSTNAFEAWQ